MRIVLFGRLAGDLSLGDSLSNRAEGFFQRVDGRAMIYSGFTDQKKKKVAKYQKNTAKDKNQTSQDSDFTAFLFMKRCKSLGLLKSFLRYAS